MRSERASVFSQTRLGKGERASPALSLLFVPPPGASCPEPTTLQGAYPLTVTLGQGAAAALSGKAFPLPRGERNSDLAVAGRRRPIPPASPFPFFPRRAL